MKKFTTKLPLVNEKVTFELLTKVILENLDPESSKILTDKVLINMLKETRSEVGISDIDWETINEISKYFDFDHIATLKTQEQGTPDFVYAVNQINFMTEEAKRFKRDYLTVNQLGLLSKFDIVFSDKMQSLLMSSIQ